MKKLIALVSVAMFCVAGFANAPSSWIASEEGRMRVEKISIGFNNARIVLESGEKIKLPLEKLGSYSLDGKIFEKKVVFKNGQPTSDIVFMELINTQNNLRLYRSAEYDFESMEPNKAVDKFYVYNGDALHLAIDEKSLPSVFNFYEIKWSYR